MDARPEDRKDGEIAEGAGELGFFPPYSWWPLWCAGARCGIIVVSPSAVLAWWLIDHRASCSAPSPIDGLDLRVLPGRATAH